MIIYSNLKERLAAANQLHLLDFWDELTNDEKHAFLSQLESVDFEECRELFRNAVLTLEESSKKLDGCMKPIPATQCGSEKHSTPEQLERYKQIGLKEISDGHVGVLLLAGGQGTRLGVSYPKGMYSVDLPSGKSLFQLQAERIRKIQELAERECNKQGVIITWYVMTSGPTAEETAEFLQCHNYFGLDPRNIVQFEQGLLPCFDLNGRILLERKDLISLSPDGNGGLYRALRKNGILDDMQQRGILYVHVHSVDNILVKVADPVFVGYCVDQNSDCGAKVVRKSCPTEAVGVVCQVNDRFQVVEYSEITEATAGLTDKKGNLVFSAANICEHFFSAKFLREVAERYEHQLKFHVAKKKIPFLNEFGKTERPEKMNGIKMEKFIFDVFQYSNSFVAWEASRRSAFSPLKNSNEIGKACPSTSRQDLYRLHKRYVEKAGGTVVGEVVEISPLVSYAGENLHGIVKGKVFYSPVSLTLRR